MSFTQIIEVDGVRDVEALQELLRSWDAEQKGVAPGYVSARLLSDRDASDRYLVEVEFTSPERAAENDDREATAAWAKQLRELTTGTPGYRNLEPVYATGP